MHNKKVNSLEHSSQINVFSARKMFEDSSSLLKLDTAYIIVGARCKPVYVYWAAYKIQRIEIEMLHICI